MKFTRGRIVVGVVLVIAVVALYFVVRPDDSKDTTPAAPTATTGATSESGKTSSDPSDLPTEPSPVVPQIVIQDGQPAHGVVKLDYKQGEQIRFLVKSDVAEEIHVHGYDVSKPVQAAGHVKFSFPADITGVFEVELENSAVPIAEIQVNP